MVIALQYIIVLCICTDSCDFYNFVVEHVGIFSILHNCLIFEVSSSISMLQNISEMIWMQRILNYILRPITVMEMYAHGESNFQLA